MTEQEVMVHESRLFTDFMRSEMGKALFKQLQKEYEGIILKAVDESKYRESLRAIENLVAFIGGKIDAGSTAREMLERMKTNTPSDEW